MTIINACTPAATTPVAQASAPRLPAIALVPGVPNRPDLVTVIPFRIYVEDPLEKDTTIGWVSFPAELDGYRGTFVLDTGSPAFWLSPSYLHRNAKGGIDTGMVTGMVEYRELGGVTAHTLRMGTLVQHLDSADVGPPPEEQRHYNAIINTFPEGIKNGTDVMGVEILGTIGLPGMEPFETIIDYSRHRVVFIRLDKAGKRLVAVPAYTPASTKPLVPSKEKGGWWGIADPSDPSGKEKPPPLLDTGGERYHFLRDLKVVGFNLRTRQFILYR